MQVEIEKNSTFFKKELKKLKDEGINFAGIDMIGDKLTEINITSPTCAREIFNQTGKNPIKEYIQGLWAHTY